MITMGKGNKLVNHKIGNPQLIKYGEMTNLFGKIKNGI